ncbi:hypothetical protein [Streptomyces sp. NPDC001843]|uniref:hypothetical protein n=1 Tax=Streptomyces sp. NPDC001843 TaxID=3364617 RepID=UPI0036C97122
MARSRAELSAALGIPRSCAGPPLALHIAGLWPMARPYRSLRDLADRLADGRARVGFPRVGDLSLQASVTAYHRLLPPPPKESLNRLHTLGRAPLLRPGPRRAGGRRTEPRMTPGSYATPPGRPRDEP